jgi:hypothetical protein
MKWYDADPRDPWCAYNGILEAWARYELHRRAVAMRAAWCAKQSPKAGPLTYAEAFHRWFA